MLLIFFFKPASANFSIINVHIYIYSSCPSKPDISHIIKHLHIFFLHPPFTRLNTEVEFSLNPVHAFTTSSVPQWLTSLHFRPLSCTLAPTSTSMLFFFLEALIETPFQPNFFNPWNSPCFAPCLPHKYLTRLNKAHHRPDVFVPLLLQPSL